MRPRTTLAAFAPPLTAQAGGVRLPDSLKGTGLPSDPADFPAKVKAGAHVYKLYRAGCPSDGGWAGAARAALVEAAETDLAIRREVATDHRVMLGMGEGIGGCPADLPRFEALLAKWLRADWEAGLLDGSNPDLSGVVGANLLVTGDLSNARDPAMYELLRSIARDPDVYVDPALFHISFSLDLRRDAARAMLGFRMNGGMGAAEAVKAVEADLAGAPPIRGHWRPPGS